MTSEAAHYEQDALWGEENVFAPSHQLERLEAIRLLLPSDGSGVVDVGAGDGRVLAHLARSDSPPSWAVASDRSAAALAHSPGPAVQSSGDALPFADQAIPGVLCCEVLEHLPDPVFAATCRELERIARDVIVLTVPNREKRRRAEVRCASCGCSYNADRHLRSFSPDGLRHLFSTFALDAVIETGPRQPVYPRFARVALERAGVLVRPGSPSCPQCGAPYRYASRKAGSTNGHGDVRFRGPSDRDRYDRLRRLAPKARHPYWLCARFVRLP